MSSGRAIVLSEDPSRSRRCVVSSSVWPPCWRLSLCFRLLQVPIYQVTVGDPKVLTKLWTSALAFGLSVERIPLPNEQDGKELKKLDQ